MWGGVGGYCTRPSSRSLRGATARAPNACVRTSRGQGGDLTGKPVESDRLECEQIAQSESPFPPPERGSINTDRYREARAGMTALTRAQPGALHPRASRAQSRGGGKAGRGAEPVPSPRSDSGPLGDSLPALRRRDPEERGQGPGTQGAAPPEEEEREGWRRRRSPPGPPEPSSGSTAPSPPLPRASGGGHRMFFRAGSPHTPPPAPPLSLSLAPHPHPAAGT